MIIKLYRNLLREFVQENIRILGDNLAGVYLHGSMVMNCFNPKKSDLDLIVVIKEKIKDHIKREYMDMVVKLNENATVKGFELSLVREEVCKPFVYPTPFELHFSAGHLNWYKSKPDDYIVKMRGTDKDLAAHFTIINHRGEALYGKNIREVFDSVPKENYIDSIWNDVYKSKVEIIDNSMYIILNLCRVLAYKRDELILSKTEGGEWGIKNLPQKYHGVIEEALAEYADNTPVHAKEQTLKEYAEYMLAQISE